MRHAKQRSYFSHLRFDLVDAVPPHVPARVLDIGAGDGSTGALLKERYPGCVVTGIEPSETAALQARAKLDTVVCADVEQALPHFAAGAFDLILLGDVLEHLRDPWAMLPVIAGWLDAGGIVVSTLPNVRNWRVVRDLALFGRWQYAQEGIMDWTHLRFFTEQSIRELFERSGLTVAVLRAVIPPRAAVVDRVTLRFFSGLLAQKYLVRARRADQ